MASITRYSDPFSGLTDLHSQLDDIFSTLVGPVTSSPVHAVPAMDVYTDDEKRLTAEVQAPGFTPDDIDITVSNGVLEIKGTKHAKDQSEDNNNQKQYVLRESHASFYRSIVLPKHADADNIGADFTDGVIKVTIPFKDLPEPKRIRISSSK